MKRINLLPRDMKKRLMPGWIKPALLKNRLSAAGAAALLVLFILLVWHGTALVRYRVALSSQKESLKKLQVQLKQAEQEYSQIQQERSAYVQEKKVLEERLQLLREARKSGIAWSKVLARISGLTPPEVWVNKIALGKDSVTIRGATEDNALVSDFMTQLDNSGMFFDTSFNYTQKSKLKDSPVIEFEVITALQNEKAQK